MLTSLALLLVAGPQTWSYSNPQYNIQSLIREIRKDAPANNEVVSEEVPAEAKMRIRIKANTFEGVMDGLAAQTPIRYLKKQVGAITRWHLTWTDGNPKAGVVRFYEDDGTYYLNVAAASLDAIAAKIKERTGYAPLTDFDNNGLKRNEVVKKFRTGPRPGWANETPEEFVDRLIEEYVEHKGRPDPPIRNSTWNLTFLQGDPPSPGSMTSKVDFKLFRDPAAAIATALNNAYAPKEGDKRAVTISPIGNCLHISGKAELVDEIRNMLATQIDISQSQILLEVDAYQVSANLKAREQADQSVQKLIIAQEIARAYKLAHLGAIKQTLMGMRKEIDAEFQKRENASDGVKVGDLLDGVGLGASSFRILGQSEMLIFLAYSPESLVDKYLYQLEENFKGTHAEIKTVLLDPMKERGSKGERDIVDQLEKLNDRFRDRALNTTRESSSMLRHFTPVKHGEDENEVTRTAVEDFLLLWLSAANKNIADLLKQDEADPPTRGASQQEKTRVSSQLKEARAQLGQADYYQTFWKLGLAVPKNSDTNDDPAVRRINKLVAGDRAAKLARAGATIDSLLKVGIECVHEDSRSLVDEPLRWWIDNSVISKSKNSTFGVRFGGTSKLLLTSRTPGISGSEADTFFPYQPVAPIGLDSLIPLLARKTVDQTPAAGATPTQAQSLAGAGMTPLETIILQGVFSQAEKQPFYRKLGSGLHFSVLPTMLPNGSTARLQVKLSMSVSPDESNVGGTGSLDKPGPVDLLKSTVVETELLANAFDITQVSSLKLDISAPGKRDWAVPILSQILPIRSWFVGPTQDKTVRHEAVVLIKVTIIPRAMDLASRYLDGK